VIVLVRFASALLIAISALALVAAAPPPVQADQLEEDTRRIGKQLQCPVCSGAPVSESPSELAGQMRAVIRAKLEAGESDQQIIAYFVERYGDSVLTEPPRRGIGLLVWVAPLVVLAGGAVLLWRVSQVWLRQRRTVSLATAPGPTSSPFLNGVGSTEPDRPASPTDRARAELEQYRRGG
jgi:cytochrome c-type biogenesis protein CcmH